MDIATVIGLVGGSALLIVSIMFGSPLSAFFDAKSIMIVLGGSASAVLVSFPLSKILGVMGVVKNCFFAKAAKADDLIEDMVRYAEMARRDGILSLENVTGEIDDPFLVAGIQMAVDGTDPDLIEAIMMSDLEAVEARHAEGKALFENVGKYAPAFGMIGTLIGLVIMLGNMADPSSIGPAMAVALITTLYGAIIANLVALPIAAKLALRSREEVLLKMIIVRGVMAIQSGDNPRIVEQKLKTFLPFSVRGSGDEAQDKAA